MKRYFVYAFPLAVLWSFVKGDISLANIIVGMLLAAIIIKTFKPLYHIEFKKPLEVRHSFKKLPKKVIFLLKLTYNIILAGISVAKIIISPKMDIKPGIIEVPIRAKTNGEITGIANSITLTPGTVTIDISDDKKILYVHAIDASDPDRIRASIKSDLEDYLLEAFE